MPLVENQTAASRLIMNINSGEQTAAYRLIMNTHGGEMNIHVAKWNTNSGKDTHSGEEEHQIHFCRWLKTRRRRVVF